LPVEVIEGDGRERAWVGRRTGGATPGGEGADRGAEPNGCLFCWRCRGCQEYHAVANTITVCGKVIPVIPVAQDVDGRRPPEKMAAALAKSVSPPDTGVARVGVKVRRPHPADKEEFLTRIKLPEKYHGPFDMDQDEVEWRWPAPASRRPPGVYCS